MHPATIGLAGLGLVLFLLALGVPVGFALMAISALGIFVLHATGAVGAGSDALTQTGESMLTAFYDLFHSYDMAMLPLFVALGNIAFYSGISTRIYDAAAVWLRPLRGGVAMASTLGCGGFAAISGSSAGCASTMGRICVPEMLRAGYDPRLAGASVAAGGTLGALIPPSILFILFGLFTDSSIAHLFMAGILPGLISLVGMLCVIAWWVREDPSVAPAPVATDGASRLEAALAAWPALLVFVVILGGIPTGWLSATEAAALCLGLTVVIGLVQRRLTPDILWRAIGESLVQSSIIFLIAGAGRLFVDFMAQAGLNGAVTDWAAATGLPFFAIIALIVVAYLILGMFLDPVSILVLTLPFMIPLIREYDMDPVWFGVIVVKLLEIGMITPPIGLNVFVIANVAPEVGIGQVFAGAARFLMVDLLVLLILILFPVVSTLIPSVM